MCLPQYIVYSDVCVCECLHTCVRNVATSTIKVERCAESRLP